MASLTNHPDIFNMLKNNIETTVRQNINAEIKKNILSDFSEIIDKELEPMLRQITIESLEKIVEMDNIGEKFNLYVKVSK